MTRCPYCGCPTTWRERLVPLAMQPTSALLLVLLAVLCGVLIGVIGF